MLSSLLRFVMMSSSFRFLRGACGDVSPARLSVCRLVGQRVDRHDEHAVQPTNRRLQPTNHKPTKPTYFWCPATQTITHEVRTALSCWRSTPLWGTSAVHPADHQRHSTYLACQLYLCCGFLLSLCQPTSTHPTSCLLSQVAGGPCAQQKRVHSCWPHEKSFIVARPPHTEPQFVDTK